MKIIHLLVTMLMIPLSSALTQDAPLALWPEGQMPGKPATEPEREEPSRNDNVIRITHVSRPMLTLYKAPEQAGKPAPAVIICPGGGYGGLAYNKEGSEIAAWLNSIGVTGVVLKYRVPDNRDGAFQDIQRAMRLVRTHAQAWNIDPTRVGVIGFSAGGHLCVRLSTQFKETAYAPLDAADQLSCRPDFTLLVYPAFLADKEGVLKSELAVSPEVPPTFTAHTEDDHAFIAGSKAYHAALSAGGIPNEFALWPAGGHGYGLRTPLKWPDRCRTWLVGRGILNH